MNPARTTSTGLVRTVRLNDAQLQELFAKMDAASLAEPFEGRKGDRFPYRLKGCVVHMQQPGDGSPRAFLVPTRNISSGGVSFLHGGYVHTGTHCVVQLITAHGTWADVPGEVVRCAYVQGQIHEVGVRFDRLIEPGDFCTSAIKTSVLLAEDDELIAKLAMTHLRNLNADVKRAVNGAEAVAAAKGKPFDLILMDLEMPVMDGLTAVRQLRAHGYSGQIVAATARTTPRDREACLTAGCDNFLPKPYSRAQLAGLLDGLKAEPLVSTMQSDPAMTELIDEFVDSLPAKVRALEEAMVAADNSALESLARSLKAEGGSYGFEPITESAIALEKLASEEGEAAALKLKVEALTKWCLLARSSARTRPAEEK